MAESMQRSDLSRTGGLNRDEVAAFLRAHRARRLPGDVGLPDGARRRTPGLRRQEVAQLAGMSVDYYIRLEQARGPRPSRQILSALARALMLSRDERDYLFRIAGEAPPPTTGPSREVGHAVRYLLDTLSEVPAYVVDAKYDVLAWNTLATHFIGDLSTVAEDDRNMIRWIFRRPATDAVWSDADSVRFSRATVADLRVAYARYPGDPGIERLVTELLSVSPRFAEMWAAHEVEERRRIRKRVAHPDLGPLEFECQVLHVPDTDQRIIVYCPAPGSTTQQTFQRLATQLTGAVAP
jgi:transcriptional regulator with XRE-family HTH domain